MLKITTKKLDKLDVIENHIKVVEEDLKDVKDSIEYAHAEIIELKEGLIGLIELNIVPRT